MAASKDNVNTLFVVAVGAVGCLILLVITLGLQALYFNVYESVQEQQATQELPTTYLDSIAADRAALSHYAREKVDGQEIIVIPITQAMEKVVKELQTPKGGSPKEAKNAP